MICVTLNASSHVARVKSCRGDLPGGALEVVFLAPGAEFTPGENEVGLIGRHTPREIGTMMRIDSLLVQRPVSPEPTISGGTVTINPVPDGTEIEVLDVSGAERMTLITADADDWTETITIADAGEYEIEVRAPGDALPVIRRFIV